MKKLLALMLVLLVALSCFAGCGTKSDAPDKDDSTQQTDEGKKDDEPQVDLNANREPAVIDSGAGKVTLYGYKDLVTFTYDTALVEVTRASNSEYSADGSYIQSFGAIRTEWFATDDYFDLFFASKIDNPYFADETAFYNYMMSRDKYDQPELFESMEISEYKETQVGDLKCYSFSVTYKKKPENESDTTSEVTKQYFYMGISDTECIYCDKFHAKVDIADVMVATFTKLETTGASSGGTEAVKPANNVIQLEYKDKIVSITFDEEEVTVEPNALQTPQIDYYAKLSNGEDYLFVIDDHSYSSVEDFYNKNADECRARFTDVTVSENMEKVQVGDFYFNMFVTKYTDNNGQRIFLPIVFTEFEPGVYGYFYIGDTIHYGEGDNQIVSELFGVVFDMFKDISITSK